MKKKIIGFLLLVFLSTACASKNTAASKSIQLIVGDSASQKIYNLTDLKALPKSESELNNIRYVGVPLVTLLRDAGFDIQTIKMVKAIANDGFSAEYNPDLFSRSDILVAYARVDSPLGSDEGGLRMVAPGEAGKLNVRMLVELQVTP